MERRNLFIKEHQNDFCEIVNINLCIDNEGKQCIDIFGVTPSGLDVCIHIKQNVHVYITTNLTNDFLGYNDLTAVGIELRIISGLVMFMANNISICDDFIERLKHLLNSKNIEHDINKHVVFPFQVEIGDNIDFKKEIFSKSQQRTTTCDFEYDSFNVTCFPSKIILPKVVLKLNHRYKQITVYINDNKIIDLVDSKETQKKINELCLKYRPDEFYFNNEFMAINMKYNHYRFIQIKS